MMIDNIYLRLKILTSLFFFVGNVYNYMVIIIYTCGILKSVIE